MRKRSEVPAAECWNVEAIYPSFDAWNQEFNEAKKKCPELKKFMGRLGEMKETKQFLDN